MFRRFLLPSSLQSMTTMWLQKTVAGRQFHFFSPFFFKIGCLFTPPHHHLLSHSSCRCGHRNRSALHWPHSPPRWRHGLQCGAGKTPHWSKTGIRIRYAEWKNIKTYINKTLKARRMTDWNKVVFFFLDYIQRYEDICKNSSIWIRFKNALPFAELFKRWSNNTPAFYNTVSTHSYISQVPPDDAVIHHDSLQKKKQQAKH